MKKIAFVLIAIGALVLFYPVARGIFVNFGLLPLYAKVGLSALALGSVILLVMAYVERQRSGGE